MRKLLTTLITAIALVSAITVNAAAEEDSNSFQVDGCTPGDIDLTLPDVAMTIPTDLLVATSTVNLVIPFEVIETGSCNITRGLTVQVDTITNIPSYLSFASSDADRIFENSLSGGTTTEGQFELTFNVTGTVPANGTVDIAMTIGAYSLLNFNDGTVNADNTSGDSSLQDVTGSPLAPEAVSAPVPIGG